MCLPVLLTGQAIPPNAAPTATGSLAQGASPAQAGPATIRTQVRLVTVDVTVTDGAGHPVRGLKRENFSLTEQGEAQAVRSFDEHVGSSRPVLTEPPLKLPPGNYTNYTPVPTGGALDVLLVDSLNTPREAQNELIRQLNAYIATAPANHQVAIFGLNGRLRFFQGFTSDPELLRAALKKNPPQNSVGLENPIDNRPPQHLSDVMQTEDGTPDGQYVGTSSGGFAADAIRSFERRVESFELKTRIRITLEALDAMGGYLAGLPGRKNLIWFSGAFPLSLSPNVIFPGNDLSYADLQTELQATLNTLTRAQVAVYPVDARGLFNAPQYDPAQRGSTDPQQFATQLQVFGQNTAEEHATMEQTARDTGGRAFYNTNGLKEAVQKVVEGGDNFYTLTYVPAKPPEPAAFHKIEVKLQGPAAAQKLALGYRRGYFGPPMLGGGGIAAGAASQSASGAASAPAGSGAATELRSAMMHGAPAATGILMKVQVLPAVAASVPAEDAPAATTRVNPEGAVKGPWRRYVADVVVPPSAVLAPVQNGSAPADLELVLHAYDADGQLLSAASGVVHLHVPAANLAQLQQEGLKMRQVISVPDRGDVFLRIGVHDLLTDQVGSVEVPVRAVRNLQVADLR